MSQAVNMCGVSGGKWSPRAFSSFLWSISFIWFIWFVWFSYRTNQKNKTNQRNQMNQRNRVRCCAHLPSLSL
ncbi:MAG: hypothetical protein E8D46_02000 [Nitrospira sp.]|nr:MAG: hypothetical protein E8D46_02000 [Nitrospira sp.]